MLATTYIAKDEIELYGAVVRNLETAQFHSQGYARLYCYVQNTTGSWDLVEKYEDLLIGECGKLYQAKKNTYFAVLFMSYDGVYEVSMRGKQMSTLLEYQNSEFRVFEFLDRSPNEELEAFDKSELKESVKFLKKLFQGE